MKLPQHNKVAFDAKIVPLWGELGFFVDGNSKITRDGGSYTEPLPNALSLPAASVMPDEELSLCPGSTETCRKACYVRGLARNVPELYRLYQANQDTLDKVLYDFSSCKRSAEILGSWIEHHATYGFRWHVSGEVQSHRHASWIREVCARSRLVHHWIYTRSPAAITEPLGGLPNLTVNISADADNYDDAVRLHLERGWRVCYLTDGPVPDDLPSGSVIFPDYSLRGYADWWEGLSLRQRKMVCPADFFGKSPEHRCGPCEKCF